MKSKDALPVKLIQFDASTAASYFSVGNLECVYNNKTTTKPTRSSALRACRPVHPKPTTKPKSTTTDNVFLLQTETILASQHPRRQNTDESNNSRFSPPKTPVFNTGKDNKVDNGKKSNGNSSTNVSRETERRHNGVTISMSILAVIVISVSVVAVWAIIAVIVIVRRTRHQTQRSHDQEPDADADEGTEMCIFFRQSKREINRPTIELQRDSYDSSPEPPAILDYTEYTGFRQPVTTHITLDYGKSKRKGQNNGYFC